jgi:hypothetical protein
VSALPAVTSSLAYCGRNRAPAPRLVLCLVPIKRIGRGLPAGWRLGSNRPARSLGDDWRSSTGSEAAKMLVCALSWP